MSARLNPSVPFESNIEKIISSTDEGAYKTFEAAVSPENIPAIATIGQLAKGYDDLRSGEYLRGLAALNPIFHKPISNILTAIRDTKEGIQTRSGKMVVPKTKITLPMKVSRTVGVAPTPLTEYYNKRSNEARTKRVLKIRDPVVRRLRKIL